jgi:hypothetical protein
MRITQRHPMMKSALRSESGVFATYTAVVLAMLGTTVAAALLLGSPRSADKTPAAVAAEVESLWVDRGEERGELRSPGTEQSAASAAAPATKQGLEINGADLTADQPVYDEAAAVSIYLR